MVTNGLGLKLTSLAARMVYQPEQISSKFIDPNPNGRVMKNRLGAAIARVPSHSSHDARMPEASHFVPPTDSTLTDAAILPSSSQGSNLPLIARPAGEMYIGLSSEEFYHLTKKLASLLGGDFYTLRSKVAFKGEGEDVPTIRFGKSLIGEVIDNGYRGELRLNLEPEFWAIPGSCLLLAGASAIGILPIAVPIVGLAALYCVERGTNFIFKPKPLQLIDLEDEDTIDYLMRAICDQIKERYDRVKAHGAKLDYKRIYELGEFKYDLVNQSVKDRNIHAVLRAQYQKEFLEEAIRIMEEIVDLESQVGLSNAINQRLFLDG